MAVVVLFSGFHVGHCFELSNGRDGWFILRFPRSWLVYSIQYHDNPASSCVLLVQNDQERHVRKRGILYKWLSRPSTMRTRPCNIYPLIPNFNIAKLGHTGVK